MAACYIDGHADSYGLGIRIAFYLQWFGIILTSWLQESSALSLKFVNAITVVATSIGLIIGLNSLQPAEIHVVLLLLCGTLYSLVLVYAWRLLTLCQPWWDPERWTRLGMGWLFRVSVSSLHGALLCLQLWFWSTGVHDRPSQGSNVSPDADCEQQFGFLFGRVLVDNAGLIAFNVIIHLLMLLIGAWFLMRYLGVFDECDWPCRRNRQQWSITVDRVLHLQCFRTVCDLCTAVIVTSAVELVISWNHIVGVNNLDSPAQLIPPAISGAYVVRSIYIWVSESEEGSRHSFRRRGGGGGGSGGSHIIRNRHGGIYTGPTDDHRRRRSHGHRRAQRTSRADPGIGGIDPVKAARQSAPMPPKGPSSGHDHMSPIVEEAVNEASQHQAPVKDEKAPPKVNPTLQVDDQNDMPTEPPPVAKS